MIYDVVIIGAGPAGISAGIYSKRSGLKTLVLESKMIGGLVNYTNVVDNYPGFMKITGPELASKMYEHFMSFDIDFKNENVVDVQNGDIKTVVTQKGEYKTKNIIIATGRSRRTLNVKGEKELEGRGISYCAMCDGHFYKGKDVIVVGAGDSSLEEALYLSNIVNKVTLICRSSNLTGSPLFVEEINKKDNIEIKYNSNVSEIISEDGVLTGVRLSDGSIVLAKGIFVYIGFDPVLPFKTELNIEREKGYILTDEKFETSVKGIYAVGDIIKKKLYQIISAEYEGAKAAVAIAETVDKENS